MVRPGRTGGRGGTPDQPRPAPDRGRPGSHPRPPGRPGADSRGAGPRGAPGRLAGGPVGPQRWRNPMTTPTPPPPATPPGPDPATQARLDRMEAMLTAALPLTHAQAQAHTERRLDRPDEVREQVQAALRQ